MDNRDTTQNRRQMVRMQDRILFGHSPVEPEIYEALARDFEKGIPLYNREDFEDVRLYINAQSALTRLRGRDVDLAEFLHYLDNKLNLLLRESRKGQSPLDRLVSQEVSLSSGGMAFFADRSFKKSDRLKLHLVLLPSYIYICCLGTVVNSQICEKGEMPYRISIGFTLLLEEDREKLIQHLFRLQSLALRNRRLKH
jgi:hypothetical protein